MRILLGGIDESDSEIMQALPGDAVAMHAVTSAEVQESVSVCSPDILLVNYTLTGFADVLTQITTILPVPAIVIVPAGTAITLPDIPKANLFGCLFRPIACGHLPVAIDITRAQYQRQCALQAEIAQLHEAFAARKIIDRAKGLVMQRHKMSESESYTYLREESRRHRIPIVDVARALLEEAVEAPAPGNTPHAATRRILSPAGERALRK